MNEVEYILRIVLQARDELAGALSRARKELRDFASDADTNKNKIDGFNNSIKNMETTVEGITEKMRAWRTVMQGTGDDNADAKKSFGDLGKEIDQTAKRTSGLLKTQQQLHQASRAANREQRDLVKAYKDGDAPLKYTVANLERVSKELDRYSAKMNTGTQRSKEVFQWARNAKAAADLIIAEENRKAKAVEDAEKRKVAAVKRANDLIGQELLDQIKREEDAEKKRVAAVKRSNAAIGKEITQQITDEENARKTHQKFLDDLEKQRVAMVKLGNMQVAREIEQQIKDEERDRRDHQKFLDDLEKKRVAMVRLSNAQIAREIEQQLRNDEKAANERVKIAQKEAEQIDKSLKLQREARAAAVRGGAARERLGSGSPLGDTDVSEIRRTAAELDRVSREYEKLSREMGHGADEARHFAGEAEVLRSRLRSTQQEAGRGSSVFSQLSQAFNKNRESAAGLDNQLRGIGWLAAFGFAQQLITVLGGLGGAFVAVAASAAQAGAAIGGMFVAGIAQAMPAIGLLVGAMARVTSVMDAVKQAQNAQQAAAVQGAGASRRSADAADTVRNAQDGLRSSQESLRDSHESLADAQRRLAEAQGDIAKARQDARRDLEDLILAEKRADLAARGAVLSQKEAQEQLRLAMASGDVESLARAELSVLESQVDAEEKLTEAKRARQEAGTARAGGVEGMEGVQRAKQQAAEAERSVSEARRGIENAERAVAKAARGIETAKRNASEAAAGTQTAAATLNYMLAQLSPAERRLYTALQNIQEAYKKTYRPITDLIIDSFTRSVEGVQKIMLMPEVISMARRTAQQISRQLNRIFDAFTTAPMIKQFLRIAEEGRKNLAPLATIVIRLGRSFANIAEAGGPALRRLIKFVGDLVEQFEKLTKRRRDMTEFFTEGEKHFEAWVNLGLAVIKMLLALAGAGGSATGKTMIEDATKAIDDLTKKINDNKDDVAAFFEDAKDITYEFVEVIEALVIELHKAFTPENIAKFADLMKTVLIPALGDAIAFMGAVTKVALDLAQSPVGAFILRLGVSMFLLSKVFLSTIGVVSSFVNGMKFFGSALGAVGSRVPMLLKLANAFKTIAGFAGRLGVRAIPFVGWAAAIAMLLDSLRAAR